MSVTQEACTTSMSIDLDTVTADGILTGMI
jgi:hypothetical protein